MTRTRCWLIACGLLVASATRADADGGAVLATREHDGLRVTVFVSPPSPRVGPVNFYVYVEESATRRPVTDARVRLVLRGEGNAIVGRRDAQPTGSVDYTAALNLPSTGRWQGEAVVESGQRRVDVALMFQVGAPFPRWVQLAPYVFAPASVIVLWACNLWLGYRRRAQVMDAPATAAAAR